MVLTARMTGRLLRRGLVGLLALLLGVAIYELLQPLVADSLGGPRGLEPFLRAMPPAFQALMRTRPEFIALSGLAGYLSLGFTHPLYIVLGATTVIGFASRALAGEMERGIIQVALARPISRQRVYAARALGLLVVVCAVAAAGPLGMAAGLAIAQPEGEFPYRHLVPAALASGLLFWAIGGLTLLGSAVASTTGRAVGWATAAVVVFYVIDYLAQLWEVLVPLEPFSLFDYYDPSQALVNGSVPALHVAVLALVGLAGVAGGLLVFARRDLPA